MNVTDFNKFLGAVKRGVNLASACKWKGKLFLFADEKHFTKYLSEYTLDYRVCPDSTNSQTYARESVNRFEIEVEQP
jgi:hypothetical protein